MNQINKDQFTSQIFSSPDLRDQSLLLHSEALGRLRRELFWTLGEERSHGLLGRIGLSCGMATGLNKDHASLIEGLGHLVEKTLPTSKKERVFECLDGSEADQHIQFFGAKAPAPQCWMLAGFLMGTLNSPDVQGLYVLETRCRAKGDPACRFVAKTKEDWGSDEDVTLEQFAEDNISLELGETRELLKLTRDRYQNLFEHSSSPIFIVDPDSTLFVDVNIAAEELTGYPKSELLRMNAFDIKPANHHHVLAAQIKALVSGHGTEDKEMSVVRKDGTERIVSISSKILNYGGQRVIQQIMRDITDLKIAEQKERDLQGQLSRSERLSSIGRLAAGVAHEIKNPLGAIRNAIYYIRSAMASSPVADNDPQIKDIIQLAEEEVDGAVRIIEELLDFSRVVQLIPRKTQVNEILEKLPGHIAIPDNIHVNMDLDMTLPPAMVDPDRINQVFSNIASNGIQSMTAGGQLTIRTRLEVAAGESNSNQDWVTVAFEDTGAGIHPQHIKKIFEPLFTTKVRGTGLGLAITNNIVEKHGGMILVASQIGKGSTFTVKLPLHGTNTNEETNYGPQKNSLGG